MRALAPKTRPVRRLIGTAIFIVAVLGRSTLYAQSPEPTLTAAAATEAAPTPVEPVPDSVRLLVGRSTIVRIGKPIARVSLTSADVADALVTSPDELLINGKAAGTISMFVWDRAGAIRRYEVVVQNDITRLTAQLKELFPKESIEVRANGRSAVLSGSVSSKDVADKMASLASSFVENKDDLVSLLQVGPAGRSNQVLLRVRFAEVGRNAMTELGVSLFTGAGGYKNWLGRSATDQVPGPVFDNSGSDPKLVFSDFLNLFFFNTKEQLGGVIKALQTKGLFQSLAEPNLIAESGKEASFLAGGEFPVPIAQGTGAGTSISVQYKEFGIRLTFTPVVIGERVHLKVRPEVSSLDFGNAVVLNGFRIPALQTRRTETEIELNDGQTFAIAGLMNNTMNSTLQKIPGIGDIPILGLLFKSKQAQKSQTELVVMITPEILRNDSPGVTPNLPTMTEPYLPPIEPKKVVPTPAPAFSSAVQQPGTPVAANQQKPATTPVTTTASKAAPVPAPADGAALLKAQSPATRTVVRAPEPEPATPRSSTPVASAPATAASPTAATAASPASASDTSAAARKTPTAAERKAEEQARKQEEKDKEVAQKAAAEEQKRAAKQAEIDAREKRADDERLARVAKEQAVKDAENDRRAAEQARKQAEIDKEHAREQAEIEKKREKAAADAERKLKEAQAAYMAELDRLQNR
jgi:pilus assembly protein CpaC